jgi:hypothetical protein
VGSQAAGRNGTAKPTADDDYVGAFLAAHHRRPLM